MLVPRPPHFPQQYSLNPKALGKTRPDIDKLWPMGQIQAVEPLQLAHGHGASEVFGSVGFLCAPARRSSGSEPPVPWQGEVAVGARS